MYKKDHGEEVEYLKSRLAMQLLLNNFQIVRFKCSFKLPKFRRANSLNKGFKCIVNFQQPASLQIFVVIQGSPNGGPRINFIRLDKDETNVVGNVISVYF